VLGIELISGHAKDVVALDALALVAGFAGVGVWCSVFPAAGVGKVWLVAMIPSREISQNATSEKLSAASENANEARNLLEKWSNLLIDFRLAVNRRRQSARKLLHGNGVPAKGVPRT
jgi:hypothetical protein